MNKRIFKKKIKLIYGNDIEFDYIKKLKNCNYYIDCGRILIRKSYLDIYNDDIFGKNIFLNIDSSCSIRYCHPYPISNSEANFVQHLFNVEKILFTPEPNLYTPYTLKIKGDIENFGLSKPQFKIWETYSNKVINFIDTFYPNNFKEFKEKHESLLEEVKSLASHESFTWDDIEQ